MLNAELSKTEEAENLRQESKKVKNWKVEKD